MSHERLQEVANDYEKLFETGEEHDVVIYAGQIKNDNVIRAHSIILRTRCQYFRAELSKEIIEKKDGKFILRELNISYRYLLIIIRYIYCGKIDLEKLQSLGTLTLLNNIKVFNIESLTSCIKEHFTKNRVKFIRQNEKLFETGEGYDVTIYAGQNENVKEIHAHSIILKTRSQYFRAEFSKNNVEIKEEIYIFRKPNILPQYLTIIVRYIYCEKIDLTKLQGFDMLNFLKIVQIFDIKPLMIYTKEHLIKDQYDFLRQNFVEFLECTYQNELLSEVYDICLESICETPQILFCSDKFVNLKAHIMELLLKRDDLLSDEIDIWNGLIKWGLAQHSNISQDTTKWNKEQITMMEKTLHRFIPLIRFYDISSEDFFYKVLPYRVLLPNQLVYKVQEFHMVPNKRLNVDIQSPRLKIVYDTFGSDLINSKHFALFASWINKKNVSVKKIPYKFILLYRASRDGMTVKEFHSKCDNKKSNILVIKIKNSNQMVGGYNPISWKIRNKFGCTQYSFIFLFDNYKNTETGKFSRVINQEYAIRCSDDKLQFGSCNPDISDSSDIMVNDNGKCVSFPNDYSDIGIPRNFDAEDIEVFQVVEIYRK
ncbi:hypothetical protein RclHR1_00210009 [Rhizophagus clarus]|uniref:BTB domain-containing protein n=1 Tax=Rhizophagus clarus TaxID=94130 RepID=A0A2Z6QRG1_9GLOM|nr:hypothetical protein RclHR1_00210009 [Rhizophagus clarus]GES81053.1 hypothetical protein GLOIN_2v1841275 [Rhizophagus clarus]